VAGVLALLYGAAVGLVRLGWNIPLPHVDQLGVHGALAVLLTSYAFLYTSAPASTTTTAASATPPLLLRLLWAELLARRCSPRSPTATWS
jgi:hypothetical protein